MSQNIVGVLLAAGSGGRFGSDKLLHRLPDGRALGIAAAQHLRAAVDMCYAVVAANDTTLTAQLRALDCVVVAASTEDIGMGTSLACGVRALPPVMGMVIALADMPAIRSDTVAQVVRALRDGASIAAPYYRARRGHPVGFAAHWRTALEALRGDRGAFKILQQYATAITRIDCDDPGVLLDIDRREDLRYGDRAGADVGC